MSSLSVRLLLVEDESKVAAFIAQGMGEEGYEVDVAPTIEKALARLEPQTPKERGQVPEYSLFIFDRMLPDGDGMDLARRCRDRGLQQPILMLTARDAVTDRVSALEIGADDYLVKPFAFAELVARVRALLRRTQGKLAVVRVGDLAIDLVGRTARRGESEVPLTGKEFAVLAYLARHAGRAVSRAELLQQVWSISGEVAVTANVVDVQIARLRDKLEAAGAATLLQTVRRQGYALCSPDSVVPEAAPEAEDE